MPTSVPIQSILFTVFQSIVQVFLLTFAGFTLSFKGIVDKPTSKVLNHINIVLFTPALLFSKVAFFLSPAKLRQLWIIPIFFTVVTVLSAVIGNRLARAFRLKRSQVKFATAASMFMNSNSLPIALMQSLATTVPLLKWGPDDTVDAMFGRSLTYLVVFSTLGMMLRWSYGIRLIAQANEPESATPTPTTYRDTDGHPALTHVTVDPSTTAKLVDYETDADIEPHDRTPLRTRPLRSCLLRPRLTPVSWRDAHWHLRLHSHLPAAPTSQGDQSESEDSDSLEAEDDSEGTIAPQSEPIDTGFSTEAEDPAPLSSKPSVRSTPRWVPKTRSSPVSLFSWLLTILTSIPPPLFASLLALFCVLVPPAQRFLKSEVMIPFKGALENAGRCSIPVTLIVLGGWFWDGETNVEEAEIEGGSDDQDNAKSKGKAIEKRHSHSVPPLLNERQDHSQTSSTENLPCLGYHVTSPSSSSSTTSLSSMIGAVLMARVHPRGGSGWARRHIWGNVGADKSDVEPVLLAAHTETVNENAPNGLGRSLRQRSQTDPVNGRARLLPTPQLPAPKSPRARRTTPPGETLTIFVTLLVRMVIVPVVVAPLMVLVGRLGWGGEVFEDPVFIVSSMLLVASPPALTLAQISQRAKANTGAEADTNADADAFSPFEYLFSRTVFWGYCVLTPPLTIVSVMAGLLLIGA